MTTREKLGSTDYCQPLTPSEHLHVSEALAVAFPKVSYPAPDVCTAYWGYVDWVAFIEKSFG